MNDAHAYYLLKIAQEKFGKPLAELDARQRDQAGRIALKQMAIEDAVLRSPEAAGVVVPAVQVREAVQQIRARYSDEKAFERDLAAHSLDTLALQDALTRELRVESVLEWIAASVPAVSETDARLYYYMNQQDFIAPEIREARHILITINDSFVENQRPQALARLSEIRARLLKKPDRFAEQAMKHSECPTALQGGLLGKVRRGTLYPEIDATLFALAAGELSDIVESPLGFHLVLCEQVMESGQLALDRVLQTLTQKLNDRERKLHQRRWIEAQINQQSTMKSTESVSHG